MHPTSLGVTVSARGALRSGTSRATLHGRGYYAASWTALNHWKELLLASTCAHLAAAIASGLSGWLQLQAAQDLGGMPGEDSARLLLIQIVNAEGSYAPAKSQQPVNWGGSRRRVDVALKGRSTGSAGWYGAIEVKWPGSAFDAGQTRLQIVQDVARLAFVDTNNLNARFLVLGASRESLHKLFDKQHSSSQVLEDGRQALSLLLSRDLDVPKSYLTRTNLDKHFSSAGARMPKKLWETFSGRLKTTLLASQGAYLGGIEEGHVFVWQCNRTRGKAAP